MYLPFNLNQRIAKNIWVTVGLFIAAFVCFELSESPIVLKIARLFLSVRLTDWIETVFNFTGLAFGAAGVYAGYQWLLASNKKKRALRKQQMQKAADDLKYQFFADPPPEFAAYITAFAALRERGLPPNTHVSQVSAANLLTQRMGSDLLAVFDFQASTENKSQENASFTVFETIYLVVSERLDLPYFQTQPESAIGGGAIGGFLKKQAGIGDINFPQNPNFSQKYMLDADDARRVERLFASPVLNFYEQNQLYRTGGENRMLFLTVWRNDPIDQNQIAAQINVLYNLYQLMKSPTNSAQSNQ